MKKISVIDCKNTNYYVGLKNSLEYITIHETGNTKKGANAIAHSNYLKNGSQTTWHYTIDSEGIIKHFDDDKCLWHCGNKQGNLSSIGVELCVNSDGDLYNAILNLIYLVKYLCKKHLINKNHVVSHNFWSGKNCPEIMLSNDKLVWKLFKHML